MNSHAHAAFGDAVGHEHVLAAAPTSPAGSEIVP